jgi:hypothetical protein
MKCKKNIYKDYDNLLRVVGRYPVFLKDFEGNQISSMYGFIGSYNVLLLSYNV